MTKKHFEALAEALRQARPSGSNAYANRSAKVEARGMVMGWELTCKAVAYEMSSMNPRFDRAKFLAACGL